MSKIGLILEGGAMRGMYTAGVLDVLMDNNIKVDGIVGVSAGALFGVNYFSNQKGRVIRYSKRFCRDLRYMSFLSLLCTGNIVNKKFAYYKVSETLDPFDDKTFINNNKEYYAVVTNINTGNPEYLKIDSCLKDMEILRATSAMPMVTKPVKINNNLYLDGAIGDSIPVYKALEMGFDKLIVVLTRPLEYKKEELSTKTLNKIKRKYKDYPKFVDAMQKRPSKYNETLSLIKDLEDKKEIFVIRPSKPIDINVIERKKEKLQNVYDLGVNDAQSKLEDLKNYLEY